MFEKPKKAKSCVFEVRHGLIKVMVGSFDWRNARACDR